MESKSRELEVAIRAALEAGKILEKYFETEMEHLIKEDKTIVTIADRESEEKIKEIILGEFPGHSIEGEETGYTENGSDYTWHVDPLDGTRNFANGIPFFATSIGLEKKGELVVGVVNNPVPKSSLFFAEKGKGAYNDGRKIYVSRDGASRAIVTSTPNSRRGEENKRLGVGLRSSLTEEGKLSSTRNFGCSALNLAYLARGSLEAVIELGFDTYDFAAGVLLVGEAGGKITDLEGNPWKFPENYFIASNGLFHDLLVEEVRKGKEKLNLDKSWPR
jgi:myo-inositol-1(or 4)-monophosphatase